jgi:ferric-dicitrate binding protein FerR (iron transport regulator)
VNKDDYLWDRSGEADPEVERLEEALAPLRHRPSTFEAPAPAAAPGRGWFRWAAAAALLAALGLATAWWRRPAAPLATSASAPTSAADVVQTDAASQTRIELGTIGIVDVGPSTRIRLLDRRADRYRLALDRGTMRAFVWAPPGAFQVETPSALAVDLGCEYTLTVDDLGQGLLTVETGWVAFQHLGRESFVPAGAQCATRRDQGPGIPYYLDASPGFRQALLALERLPQDGPQRSAALAEVMREARARDAMTLWHLLVRARGDDRVRLYTRMAQLVPPPSGVTRAGVAAGAAAMLDAWWDELGLGSVEFWRKWKADWAAAR